MKGLKILLFVMLCGLFLVAIIAGDPWQGAALQLWFILPILGLILLPRSQPMVHILYRKERMYNPPLVKTRPRDRRRS